MKRTFLSSFFYDAIKNGNKELVDYLLHNDASYDNALFIVSEFAHDDIEIVDIIIKNDNTPFFIDRNGSAINIAVKSGKIKIVKRLLSIPGIDLKICVNNETPLVSAFSSFNLDIINLFYDYYGDDIQSQTWQINEALKIVLEKISEDKQKKYESLEPDVIMKFIEKKSFDINCQVNISSCANSETINKEFSFMRAYTEIRVSSTYLHLQPNQIQVFSKKFWIKK